MNPGPSDKKKSDVILFITQPSLLRLRCCLKDCRCSCSPWKQDLLYFNTVLPENSRHIRQMWYYIMESIITVIHVLHKEFGYSNKDIQNWANIWQLNILVINIIKLAWVCSVFTVFMIVDTLWTSKFLNYLSSFCTSRDNKTKQISNKFPSQGYAFLPSSVWQPFKQN